MIGSQIERLKHIRKELAGEITEASRENTGPVMMALVRARDNLNDALIAAGDGETARTLNVIVKGGE